MEQKKNIIQLFGDFIEENESSWIFPHKEESLLNAGKNVLSLLFLIPLYSIIFVVRILLLLSKLFISLFVNLKKPHNLDRTSILNRQIAQTLTYGILIACTFFFSVRILHNYAKERNVTLRNSRHIYDFTSYAIDQNMPEDNLLRGAFYAIKEAVKNDYTNRDVVRLRKQLNVDEDFAKGLHFSSPDDFMLFLYSIKDIDKGVQPYINEADSIGVFDNMLYYYQEAALNDYMNGNFYNSSAEMKHYFNIYENQGDYPLAGVNNKMHLLKLLLQRQWELTTNRKFAEVTLSCINSVEYSEPYRFSEYGKLKSINNEKPFLQNISIYFEGLSLFYNKKHMSALQQFESCYERTTDTTLKQYCALMSIRTAFWNYDKLRNNQALTLYKKMYKKYSPVVTLHYFKPDLQRYQSVVLEIINNPKYTGYDDDFEDDCQRGD